MIYLHLKDSLGLAHRTDTCHSCSCKHRAKACFQASSPSSSGQHRRPSAYVTFHNAGGKSPLPGCVGGAGFTYPVLDSPAGSQSTRWSGELLSQAWVSWKQRSEALQSKVQQYGTAGIASMVLCNSLYYTLAFLFCWLGVLKPPKGLGLAGAGRRFVEVFAMMYLGSQASKLPRAAGMLALAPLVDQGLQWVQQALGLQKGQVLRLLVVICLSVSLGTYGAVVLIWA